MTVDSIAKNMMSDAFMKVASGKRINSAADDAAGLAIAEKMEALIRGFDRGTQNTADMQNLVKTAEGGLDTISDSLQRIRELSLQAANGIYNDEDRALIQQEVGQLIDHIGKTAQNAEFNKQKLLDGSFENKHTASSPDGSGLDFSIKDMNALYESIKDYDVSKNNFDINRISDAISFVSEARSELGAISNRFDHTMEANNIAMLNQAAAKSRIADMDMAKGMMDVSRDRVLTQAQIYMQKQNQNAMQKNANVFNANL